MKVRNMEKYVEYLKSFGVELNEMQIKQFDKFYEMLVEKNKVMNLTGITEYEEVLEKHFLDSIAIYKEYKIGGKLIDVGTGAGFPGIPLKIAFPDMEVVLLDSLNKRIKFLDEVIEELGLKKIETIHGRAEDFAVKTEYREHFDYCVSRAVANLSSLSEYCLPFVKVGGDFIPYKSGDIDIEVNNSKNAIKTLGGDLVEIKKFELPTSGSRSFVRIEKVKNTNKKYPRKAGLPTKEPLK